MAKPDTVYLYRITHIDNFDFILESGKLTCPNNPDCDASYIGIGDKTLIDSRSSKQINIKPNGNFTDYVAFYFGVRSPMLYSIQKSVKQSWGNFNPIDPITSSGRIKLHVSSDHWK